MGDEQRISSRSSVQHHVEVTCEDGRSLSGALIDVSVNGLFMATDERLESEAEGDVKVLLEMEEGNPIELNMRGRVTRQGDRGLAVEFLEVDAESVLHLRNLVQYNSEHPDKVQDEFDGQLGIRRKP